MTIRKLLEVLALVAVMAIGAVACGVPSDDQARFEPEGAVPFDLLGTMPPGTDLASPAGGAIPVQVCLVGADGRVHPVSRTAPPGGELVDLIAILITGPTDTERSFGLTTAIVEPGTVDAVAVDAGVGTVDLDEDVTSIPTADQLIAVTQIVCTLTDQPGVGQVRFRVAGRPIAVPRGDGSSTTDAVSRADYEQLIAPPG